MLPIEKVYPEYNENERYSYFCDYSRLLDSFEYEILIQVDDQDYQGDSRVLFFDKSVGRYGYLNFGWGSCSGCDALQSCTSLKEVEKLRDSLHTSIIWQDSKEEMLAFFQNRDWETQYSWHAEETKEFVKQCVELLGK